MNKLIVENDKVSFCQGISYLEEKGNSILGVTNLSLSFTSSGTYEVEYQNDQKSKRAVQLIFSDDIEVVLLEKHLGMGGKVQNHYQIGKNTTVTIQKIYQVTSIHECDAIDLKNRDSVLEYIVKTLGTGPLKFDCVVTHQAPNTKSNVIHHGIHTSKENLTFNVTGIVKKGAVGSQINQGSRILTLEESLCKIQPNLFIEEEEVNASHSAHLGKFSVPELFYLQSRGIKLETALFLLSKGLFFQNLSLDETEKKELEDLFLQYWR